MYRRKTDTKGFTLIEVIVTLVLLAILAGMGYGTVARLVARAEQSAQDDMARTLFMAAQSALTHAYANDPAMVQSLESASETVSLGLISPVPESAEWQKELAKNEGNILSLSSNAGDGAKLLALLDSYVADKTVLEHNILIEYNRYTGNVLACFYSKQATLCHDDSGYNVYERGEERLQSGPVGMYMVEYTGSRAARQSRTWQEGPNELSVMLVDYDGQQDLQGNNVNGGNNYGLLTLECALPANAAPDMAYEISIHSYAGGQISNIFTLRVGPNADTAHVAMHSIGSNLKTALHAPIRYTEGGEARAAVLFTDPQPDKEGRTLLVLVLDSQVEGAGIGVLYPELADGELMATVTAHSARTGTNHQATSNSTHALYASVDERGAACVASIRHLNNLRYNAGSSFAQTRDISVSDYAGKAWTMAPLGDAAAQDGAFSGNYDGNDYKILGLNCPADTQNAALFAAVAEGGRVTNVHLVGSQIMGTLRAGGIAAENRGTINACTVYHAADTAGAGGLTIRATGTAALAGGIVADNRGVISGCAVYHTADVRGGEGLSISATGTGARAGGIAARNAGVIQDCRVNYAVGMSFAPIYITASGAGAVASGIAADNSGSVTGCQAGAEVITRSGAYTAPAGLPGVAAAEGGDKAMRCFAFCRGKAYTTILGIAG